MGFVDNGEDEYADSVVAREVYSTIAGVPAVTRYVPATVKHASHSMIFRNDARIIPLSLPRLKFIHGEVSEAPPAKPEEPLPAKEEEASKPLWETHRDKIRKMKEERMLGMELTPKEQHIYDLSLSGMSAIAIAEHLGLSRSTASTHLVRVRRKLGIGLGSSHDATHRPLSDIIPQDDRPVMLRHILLEVCQKRGLSIDDVAGPSMLRELIDARREYVKISRARTRKSLAQIGKLINRDHTTVLYLAKTDGPTKKKIRLSPRERAVHDLMQQGFGCKRIGEQLGLASGTVSRYMRAIKSKIKEMAKTSEDENDGDH